MNHASAYDFPFGDGNTATIGTENGHTVVRCSDPAAASSIALMKHLQQANRWADMFTAEGIFSVQGSFNQVNEAVKTFHAQYIGEAEGKELTKPEEDKGKESPPTANSWLARALSGAWKTGAAMVHRCCKNHCHTSEIPIKMSRTF